MLTTTLLALLIGATPDPVPPTIQATVVDVIDGDTIDVALPDGRIERIRLIGIDTPETGECGYGEAAVALSDLLGSGEVVLTSGAADERDNYDRLLRYVSAPNTDTTETEQPTVDVGSEMLGRGVAIARYDSRDGYGRHFLEDDYVSLDAATPNAVACPVDDVVEQQPIVHQPAAQTGNVHYENCDAVRAAGAAPIYPGDPGWQSKLDRDNDGVGCE